MWFKIIFLLSQYIIYDKNGLSEAKPMIGNIGQVESGQLKWIVSIKTINKDDEEQEKFHGLTGSLVSNKHVLTVAHGLLDMAMNKLECRLSTVDIRDDRWTYNISSIITYDQWAYKYRFALQYEVNDIAIVTLDSVVPDSIVPVVISPLPEDVVIGLDVIVAGWGMGSDDKFSRYLKYGYVHIISREHCKNRVFNATGEHTLLHERYLCSYAEPYVILRRGDSGGPVFLPNGELVAITRASCPSPDGYHPLKINIHLGIHFYRFFIAHCVTRF